MFGRRPSLRAAVVAGASVTACVFVSCVSGCAGSGRTEAAAHSVSPVVVSASASATVASSPTPSVSASPSSATPSPTPSQATSSAAAHGGSGSTPRPVSQTTAASSPKLYASPTIAYGQLSFLSLTSGRLCLSVPVTVSNHGNGRVYAINVSVSIQAWRAQSGKVTFPLAPYASSSETFTLCFADFTQPAGTCYSVYAPGVLYWGDPDPNLGSEDAVTPNVVNFCIPRQP